MDDMGNDTGNDTEQGADPVADPAGTGAGETPELSIIVVNYNTCEMTQDCIRSIHAETVRTAFELIVIDNNSPDGSAAAFAEAFPQDRVIASPDNLGFARANNVAAREARGTYLLLLNPDTLVLDGAIDRLMDFARAHPQAQIWGGRTLFGDRTLNPTSCHRQMTPWSLFCRASGLATLFPRNEWTNAEHYGGWDRSTEREVDIVTGCFLLLPRALWEELGGFDLSFVMFGEEADLCLRATQRGARPRVTPEATIVHYGGASSSQQAPARRLIQILCAKRTMVAKHWTGLSRLIGVPLFYAWPLGRYLATGIAARLFGRGRAAHDAWAEVWRRRAEWENGYPPA